MAGKEDVSRLTVQVGRFAVHDLFDTNAYAQDPRVDFLSWSIWAAGAFDYPADRVGLTWVQRSNSIRRTGPRALAIS